MGGMIWGIPAIAHPSSSSPVLMASQPAALMAEGQSLFQSGQLTEAASRWRQAAQQYGASGDSVNQALSLSYLSLAYQELGQWDEAQSAIMLSLDLLDNQPNDHPGRQAVLAQVLNTQGSLQLALGQLDTALQTWEQAEAVYQSLGDLDGQRGAQLNQAHALQALGFYRRAYLLLEQINAELQTHGDSALKANSLLNLGIVIQTTGNLNLAATVLEQSLEISQRQGLVTEASFALLNLGNVYRAQSKLTEAIATYEQAVELAPGTATRLEIHLNHLRTLLDAGQWQDAQRLINQIQAQLADLSSSRTTVLVRVGLAESLMRLRQEAEGLSPETMPTVRAIADELAIALQQARELQDSHSESLVLGQLGHLYEQQQQWNYAEQLTQDALTLSQSTMASELSYRWYWQLGRVLREMGDIPGAIAAYNNAVDLLQSLRADLVAVSPDAQFAFRQQVEPVYRELASLLLLDEQRNSDNLGQAREVIEALQIAELENFFRTACLDVVERQIDQIDPTAAIVYPIILADRLAVVVAVPGEPLHYHAVMQTDAEIKTELNLLLQSLNPAFSDNMRLRLSAEVYDWLIRPVEPILDQQNIETLVFVPDGILKNIPMAALYDGEHYLVERFNIAITPSLQLLGPHTLTADQLDVFLSGLTEARQGFPPLPGVAFELDEISSEFSADIRLVNQDFTKSNFQQGINTNPAAIVHLASHGQFSSEPQETFILTWDDRISIQDFYAILQDRTQNQLPPIQILVLSACQTATGDDRAALGLAGLAVRSGARSTIATLWAVNDASMAELMSEFYQNLSDRAGQQKARALREAQLTLLQTPEYAHPYYWAPVVLVGNWL
jgi:CHAT domain-containing protein